MKILAIGAHPDDIEIYMYGFLKLCLERNDEIIATISSDGAAGNVSLKNDLKNIRKKESIEGLKKICKPNFLDLDDGYLSHNSDCYRIINRHIIDINPDLVITHSPNDYHPDHRALSSYVSSSTGFKCPILYCDTFMGVNFQPNYYIKITKYFSEKKEAILSHKSQNPKKFVNAVEIWNQFRSAQCNHSKHNYAEAFKTINIFPFSEIRSLLPQNIQINTYYNNSKQSLI